MLYTHIEKVNVRRNWQNKIEFGIVVFKLLPDDINWAYNFSVLGTIVQKNRLLAPVNLTH